MLAASTTPQNRRQRAPQAHHQNSPWRTTAPLRRGSRARASSTAAPAPLLRPKWRASTTRLSSGATSSACGERLWARHRALCASTGPGYVVPHGSASSPWPAASFGLQGRAQRRRGAAAVLQRGRPRRRAPRTQLPPPSAPRSTACRFGSCLTANRPPSPDPPPLPHPCSLALAHPQVHEGHPLHQALCARLDSLPICSRRRESSAPRPPPLHLHRHRLPRHEEGAGGCWWVLVCAEGGAGAWHPLGRRRGCCPAAAAAAAAACCLLLLLGSTERALSTRCPPCGSPGFCVTLAGWLVRCGGMQAGSCIRGDKCPFAHNVFEYWLHPTRYRTQVGGRVIGWGHVPGSWGAPHGPAPLWLCCCAPRGLVAGPHPTSCPPSTARPAPRPPPPAQLCNDGPTCRRGICFFAHRWVGGCECCGGGAGERGRVPALPSPHVSPLPRVSAQLLPLPVSPPTRAPHLLSHPPALAPSPHLRSLDELRVPACKPYVSPEALARASLEAIQLNPHPLGQQLPNPGARRARGSGGTGGCGG